MRTILIVILMLLLKIGEANAQRLSGLPLSVSYYAIPKSFADKIDRRTGINDGTPFTCRIDMRKEWNGADSVTTYLVGVMYRTGLKPAFDSLAKGYWGAWDSTVKWYNTDDLVSQQ